MAFASESGGDETPASSTEKIGTYEGTMNLSQGVKATYVGPTYDDTNPGPTVKPTEEPSSEPTEDPKGEDGEGGEDGGSGDGAGGTVSGNPLISIDVSWGNMLFDYKIEGEETWNPKTHKNEKKEMASWSVRNNAGNLIKVINRSETDIKANFIWINNTSLGSSLSGGFYKKDTAITSADKISGNIEIKKSATYKAYIHMSGKLDKKYTKDVKLGKITVSLE